MRALVKLEQVLPSHLRRRGQRSCRTVTSTLAPRGPTIDPETLTAIAGACTGRERLASTIAPATAPRAAAAWSRTASSTSAAAGTWSRSGRDRQDWRTFRVDRLSRPSGAGSRFQPRALPGDDPAAFVASNLSNTPHRFQAVVLLHAPAAAFRERTHLWGSVEEVDADTCEYRTADDSLEWLAMRIAMLGVGFEVLEPPALADTCRTLAERFGNAAAAGA